MGGGDVLDDTPVHPAVHEARSRTPPTASPEPALRALVAEHRTCSRCVAAGYIARALPVVGAGPGRRILLVGQAPGPVEQDVHRPFAGRAGRLLFRWLVRAGFRDEADARARIWISSTTACFPGRNAAGTGDRRPSAAEVALCAPWLDGYLRLLDPPLVITVGGMGWERVTGRRDRLDDVIGTVVRRDGRTVVPLPHPSGQSRWLNDPARVRLLDTALGHLRAQVEALGPPPKMPAADW